MDGGARQLRSSQKSGAREGTDRAVPTSMRAKDTSGAAKAAAAKKRGRPKRRNAAAEETETGKGRQTTADVPISEEEWDVAEYRAGYLQQKARADRFEALQAGASDERLNDMAKMLRDAMDKLMTATLKETQEMMHRQQERHHLEMKELRGEMQKMVTRIKTDTTTPRHKASIQQKTALQEKMTEQMEQVDLVSPPGSPSRVSNDGKEHRRLASSLRSPTQPATAKSSPQVLSAPAKQSRSVARPIPSMSPARRAADVSVGVEACPEVRVPLTRSAASIKKAADKNSDREKSPSAQVLPSLNRFGEKNPNREKVSSTRASASGEKPTETAEVERTPLTTAARKRSLDDKIQLVYSKGKTPVHSQALAATHRAINRTVSRSAFGKSTDVTSCYDLFPGLEIFGFERQLISENEIVYRHVMTSEVFAFLSENFNSDEKEMQFQPMTHGDLWRCLPDELKAGQILFKRSQLKNFASVIVRCMVECYDEAPSKKPCLRKSI